MLNVLCMVLSELSCDVRGITEYGRQGRNVHMVACVHIHAHSICHGCRRFPSIGAVGVVGLSSRIENLIAIPYFDATEAYIIIWLCLECAN